MVGKFRTEVEQRWIIVISRHMRSRDLSRSRSLIHVVGM